MACTSRARHLRIIAGAGTGKTRTLTYRLAYLIRSGIPPSQIVAITFTNKVANEMQSRVDNILKDVGCPSSKKPLICTFHAFCCRFLRKEIGRLPGYTHDFTIMEDEDSQNLYRQIFSGMVKGSSKDFTTEVTDEIKNLKTQGKFVEDVTLSDVPQGARYTYDELIYVYQRYQVAAQKQNMLDFDDLLMFTYRIMTTDSEIREYWKKKFRAYLVDEFQDTNRLQYQLIRIFLDEESLLTIVGDPDQTIYTWRGAENDIIKTRLERDFPDLETIVLDDNYRSTQEILDVANKLIGYNHDRVKKNLHAASNIKGKRVEYLHCGDQDKEAFRIASIISRLVREDGARYQDIAIIYRSNYLSNKIEKQMTAFKIPYVIYGGLKFYERSEIKAALSYLRLAINPDDFSFRRILKAPSKGIGDVTLSEAQSLAERYDTTLLDIFLNHQDELRLNRASKASLDRFFRAFKAFKNAIEGAEDDVAMSVAIRRYFTDTGFLDYVKSEDMKNEKKNAYTAVTSTSKIDNVNELLNDINSFLEKDQVDMDGNMIPSTLNEFLINVALQSDQDTIESTDKVSLMTGHVSKGLEFPYVFVTGLNEDIFPSYHALQSFDSDDKIEEERRLCYVCMTRAQKELYLSSFDGFDFRNGMRYKPSRFLKEAGFNTRKAASQEPEERQAYVGSSRPRPSFSTNTADNFIGASSSSIKRDHSDDDTYAVGDKVVHTSFGVGEVIGVEDEKILVNFPQFGVKKLVVGFPAFRKVKEDEI